MNKMSFLFDMQSTQIMWPSTYFSYPTPQPAQLSPAASPELEPRVTLGGTSHYETQTGDTTSVTSLHSDPDAE